MSATNLKSSYSYFEIDTNHPCIGTSGYLYQHDTLDSALWLHKKIISEGYCSAIRLVQILHLEQLVLSELPNKEEG